MIIKYDEYVTWQRCGDEMERSGEIRYSSLDELYEANLIDGFCLKRDWSKIEDIVVNNNYSLVRELEYAIEFYQIKL